MDMEYNDNSIKSLKGAERVRERVNVMFGSDDIRGAFHTVVEIIGNSLDECRAGYGDKVIVTYHSDRTVSVRDYGRGVPMGWNEKEGRYNWDLIFNELYAGGKYGDNEAYKYSVGLNGLGAASVQYTSEKFDVMSYTKDSISTMHFEKGNPIGELEVKPNDSGERGTFISWKVDPEVFTQTEFTEQMFIEYCEVQANIAGVTIELKDEVHNSEYVYEGKGLKDYLRQKVGDKEIETFEVHNKSAGVTSQNKAYKAEADIVIMITDETHSNRMFFHNTAVMRNINGYHHKAFDTALADFFKTTTFHALYQHIQT